MHRSSLGRFRAGERLPGGLPGEPRLRGQRTHGAQRQTLSLLSFIASIVIRLFCCRCCCADERVPGLRARMCAG